MPRFLFEVEAEDLSVRYVSASGEDCEDAAERAFDMMTNDEEIVGWEVIG